jgi:hypothetical protein
MVQAAVLSFKIQTSLRILYGGRKLPHLSLLPLIVLINYFRLHTGVVIGKDMVKAFYGKPHHKSYYLGCSTGGRQGFKVIQDFPGDFGERVPLP